MLGCPTLCRLHTENVAGGANWEVPKYRGANLIYAILTFQKCRGARAHLGGVKAPLNAALLWLHLIDEIQFKSMNTHSNADGLSCLLLKDQSGFSREFQETTVFNISQIHSLPVTSQQV